MFGLSENTHLSAFIVYSASITISQGRPVRESSLATSWRGRMENAAPVLKIHANNFVSSTYYGLIIECWSNMLCRLNVYKLFFRKHSNHVSLH